jgi:hypothetical protein
MVSLKLSRYILRIENDETEPTENRQVLYMDHDTDEIDFVTLHNILYYIYTGCVNLFQPNIRNPLPNLPKGYPDQADPVSLFRNADKFMLPELRDRCYKHLQFSLTVENVAERLFSTDAQHHEDLRKL